MSELLQNWLNNEVGLSTNVANFERDFANGYLFGEILHKFRQQDDFDRFSNKNTYEAKIANFKRLAPTLKALGIKFNATQSNAMMAGERGASLRMLYQMKMATERLLLACDSGGAMQAAAPAGGGVTKGIRIPRDKYDGHEHRFFEHRLRATCPNVKQQRLDKVTAKFVEERHKQEIVSMEMDHVDQARIQEQREIHRFSLRERMRQNKAAKDEWTSQSKELWEQTMKVRAMREQHSIDFENNVHGKQMEHLMKARDHAAGEVLEGIDVFEKGLENLGLSAAPAHVLADDSSEDSDRSENAPERLMSTTTPATNARELVESLQARMPSPQELQREAGLFLRKIKESKHAGSIARKERERRRRRVLVEQQREQDLLEESKLEEVLLETLSRESAEEKRISYTVWRTKKYEDVIVQNRQLRTKEYTARRKADQKEALRRDKDLYDEMLDVMREQEERERVRYRAIERGRRAEHLGKLSEECEGILELVKSMAIAALQQEQITDKEEVDETLWREWTSLFVENVPVDFETLAFRFEPEAFRKADKEALLNQIRNQFLRAGVPSTDVDKLKIKIVESASTAEVSASGPLIDVCKERFIAKPFAVMGMLPHVSEVPKSRALERSVDTMYPLTALPPPPDADDVQGSILDEAALRDYVSSQGQWQVGGGAPGVGAEGVAAAGGDSGNVPAVEQDSMPPADAPAPTGFDPAQEMARLIQEECQEVSFVDRLEPHIDVVGNRPVNYRLGAIVAALLDRTYAQPPRLEPPPMPDVPLKLVMTGKPFAGKRTLAARLAETYGLQVVDVDETVRECFLLSKRPDIATTGPIDVLSFTAEAVEEQCQRAEEEGNPYVRQLQEIGSELQQRLDRGEAIDNETYVHLITTKIRSLFPELVQKAAPSPDGDASPPVDGTDADPEPAATPAAPNDGDTSTGPAPRAGSPGSVGDGTDAAGDDMAGTAEFGGGGDEVTRDPAAESTAAAEEGETVPTEAGAESSSAALEPSGWILVGFPEDRSQLDLLERFLSGWVPLDATPTPEAEVRKLEASLICPAPPSEPPVLEPISGGYDLHIRLEVPGDEAVRRAIGRRVDPANALQYHLEDSPPCMKNQIIYERLQPVDDLTNSMGTLTARIHSFDVAQAEVEAMLSYFGPFPEVERLVCIDAHRPAESVYDSLEEQVAILLERKRAQKAKEVADAQEAAAAAEEAAKDAKEAAEEEQRKYEEELAAAAPVPEPPEDPKAKGKAKAKAEPKKAEPAAQAVAEPEETIPTPEPTALAELPKVVEKLEDNLFNLLLTEWREMQANYLASTRQLFSWHRSHREDFSKGLHGIQQRFVQYLQRQDDKQVLLDEFVQRFNRFSEEYPAMRKQEATKDELHQQVDDLHDKLQSKVNSHKDECAAQLRSIEETRWVEAQVEVFAAQVQHAVRLEARRYHVACQLLTDFYWGAMGNGLPPAKEAPPAIDALSDKKEEEVVPDPKAKKPPPKGKAKEEEPPPEDPAIARAAKLRKRVPAAEDGGIPAHWEFPFLEELVKQANQVVVWKPTEFGAPAAEEEKEPDPKDAKAKAKGKPKPKAAPEPTKAPKEPAPALYVDLQQALLAERVAFRHRLHVLKEWAERRLLAMTEIGEDTFSRLHDWVLLRRSKELDAVLELSHILKEHIEDEALINSRLTLEGAHLHQHPNVLLKAPKPPVIPPALENAFPYRWAIDQLDNLLEVLRCAARTVELGARVLPTHALLAILMRITQSEKAGTDDVREEPMVPAQWRPADIDRLNSLISLFDHPPRAGTIDCVEFLFHLGLLHCPSGWPSLATLIGVREKLEYMMPQGCRWPDFWITSEQFEDLPLFPDPQGAEHAVANKFKPETAEPRSDFDRTSAQQRWLGRVLKAFPAPLRQNQAWELENDWYRYHVRNYEEAQRSAAMFADDKEDPSGSPHGPPDAMASLVATTMEPEPGIAGLLDLGEKKISPYLPPPPPPRPEVPTNVPEPPSSDDSISVRQLLTYLCQGSSPEDGLMRAIAVLGPDMPASPDAVDLMAPPEDFHAVLLQLGARPTPPPVDGAGKPRQPSLIQLYEELGFGQDGLDESNSEAFMSPAGVTFTDLSTASFMANPRSARLLARMGLGRRHCRAPVEKLFPTNLKPGARLPAAELR